jgi:hypothetical protein
MTKQPLAKNVMVTLGTQALEHDGSPMAIQGHPLAGRSSVEGAVVGHESDRSAVLVVEEGRFFSLVGIDGLPEAPIEVSEKVQPAMAGIEGILDTGLNWSRTGPELDTSLGFDGVEIPTCGTWQCSRRAQQTMEAGRHQYQSGGGYVQLSHIALTQMVAKKIQGNDFSAVIRCEQLVKTVALPHRA